MVILWDKMPLSMPLACGLEVEVAGRHLPPRRTPSPARARLQHAGNPRFEYLLFLVYSILILK